MRDVERQLDGVAQQSRVAVEELIGRTNRILSQNQKDRNKLYVLHSPEVECMANGEARKPYEFGVKVSSRRRTRMAWCGRARCRANPYDGDTLVEALEQSAILSDVQSESTVVDRGYKGVAIEDVKVYHLGLRCSLARGLCAMIR